MEWGIVKLAGRYNMGLSHSKVCAQPVIARSLWSLVVMAVVAGSWVMVLGGGGGGGGMGCVERTECGKWFG